MAMALRQRAAAAGLDGANRAMLHSSRRRTPAELGSEGVNGKSAVGREAQRQEFEALLAPLLKPLYNTALGFTRHPTEAEDAVQETVLRAYRSFDQYRRGTNFKAWVFRILTNHCINRFRRKERGLDAVGFEEVEREAELAGSREQSPSVAPETALFDGLLGEEVQTAIASLPEEFRVVVILSDLQDYTYREIADFLGIPIGTVRSRLFRGRRMLRDLLETHAREHGIVREADHG